MQDLRSYKIKNPYRADQEIKQEVSISQNLVYDYSDTPWISVDTEYLSFNPLQDKLCVIQIASKENVEAENLRVEVIYVFDQEPTDELIKLFTNKKIEKIFHVFSADVPRIENYLGTKIKGSIFDTKVAAKIAWTNTQNHGMKSLIRMFADPDFHQLDSDNGLNDWEIGPENWSNDQIYYMMQDVIYLDVLRNRILDMAERRGVKELVLETMKTIPVLVQLYRNGYTENVLSY
ncbi:hypothetical protein GF362_03090 [Candidatus Dojkabacteria bacterium]|nr:hypothetical protein [Candidatus Dojkabacteria bacterium]